MSLVFRDLGFRAQDFGLHGVCHVRLQAVSLQFCIWSADFLGFFREGLHPNPKPYLNPT